MKIISKHHDYYDTVQAYGFDDTVIYIRHKKEIFNKELLKELKSIISHISIYEKHSNLVRDNGILFFCGKKYPFVNFELSNNGITVKSKYYYEFKSLNNLILNRFKKKKKLLNSYINTPKYRFGDRFSEQSSLKSYFTLENDSFENNVKLHEKYETPVFIVYDEPYERNIKLILNPNLKKINFQTVFDPFRAHQEIDMFLSGVMQSKEKDLIQISDKYQKYKKGFDDMSFKPKMRAKHSE